MWVLCIQAGSKCVRLCSSQGHSARVWTTYGVLNSTLHKEPLMRNEHVLWSFAEPSWKKIWFCFGFFFGFLIALSPTWHILLPNVFLTFSLTHNLQVLFQFKIIRDNNFNTLCCLTPRLWHGTMQFILVSQISIYLLLYLQIHIW